MFKSKIVAMMALIVFAMAVILVGNAVAGEKHRLSIVFHTIKAEEMNAPGEDGHVIGLWEGKGIVRNKDGKPFGEGWIIHTVCYSDSNMKAGIWAGHCYDEWIDRGGDKIYTKGEGNLKTGGSGPYLGGTTTFTRGIGKYEGVRGEYNWEVHPLGPDQSYADLDAEVEMPR